MIFLTQDPPIALFFTVNLLALNVTFYGRNIKKIMKVLTA